MSSASQIVLQLADTFSNHKLALEGELDVVLQKKLASFPHKLESRQLALPVKHVLGMV